MNVWGIMYGGIIHVWGYYKCMRYYKCMGYYKCMDVL